MDRSRLNRLVVTSLLFTYLVSLLVAVQLAPQGPLEKDGYYHARLAAVYADQGLLDRFPWTQVSTWRDRYCDKEFLYHALMMPLVLAAGQEPIRGALAFTVLLNVALFALLLWMLRRRRVSPAALFCALPLCLGGIFLARMTMVRSHVLSMLLLLLGLHLLLEKRRWALLALGFVYAWSYTVPYALVMTAIPFVLGRLVAGGGLDWRSPLTATVGVTLGLIVHPYSPHTLESLLTYVQVVASGFSGSSASGLELGHEIYPLTTRQFLGYYPFFCASLLALLIWGWRSRQRIRPDAAGALFAALFWFGMSLLFARFTEYTMLLWPVALALVFRDACGEQGPSAALQRRFSSRRRTAVVVAAMGGVILAGFHLHSLADLAHYLRQASPPRFRGATAWMARNLPPGETVLNLYWDDFPELFYFGGRQRYIWGLDPTYTLKEDPKRGRLLEAMRARRRPLDGPLLRRVFGTRYMVLRRARAGRYPQIANGSFRLAYRDKTAVIVDLARKSHQPSAAPPKSTPSSPRSPF